MTDIHEDPVFGTDASTTRLPLGLGMGEAVSPLELVAVPEGGESTQGGGMFVQIGRVFIQNKLAVVGLIIIVAFVLFCFVGPLLYHTDQTNQQAVLGTVENGAPQPGHPLGTDSTGFDILGRLMYGGQTSLIVGFASAFVATVVGVLFGATAGFFGGSVDAALSLMDVVELTGVAVRGTVVGFVGGPAVGLLAVCTHRMITPHGRVRLVEADDAFAGPAGDLVRWAEDRQARWALFCRRLATAAGRPVTEVADDLRSGRFLGADDAVRYGLVDEICRPDATIHRLPSWPIGFRPR